MKYNLCDLLSQCLLLGAGTDGGRGLTKLQLSQRRHDRCDLTVDWSATETLKLKIGNYYIPTSLSSANDAQELIPHSEASGVTVFSGRAAAIVLLGPLRRCGSMMSGKF